MPEITRFYGIIIKLFFGDHPPPHFHAVYGEHNAVFNIETLEMIEGDLPSRARKLVVEWANSYQSDLQEMWESQEFKKLPPLNSHEYPKNSKCDTSRRTFSCCTFLKWRKEKIRHKSAY